MHGAGDRRLGQPLCPDCYDYLGQVVWNGYAPLLWKRTHDAILRRLAALSGRSERAFRAAWRLTFARVVEMQIRGVVHFHVVFRLDGAGPAGSYPPPPGWASAVLLERAVRQAAATVTAVCPDPHLSRAEHAALTVLSDAGVLAHAPPVDPAGAVVRWGDEVDVRVLHAGDGELTAAAVAAYIAKYATKGTDALAVLDCRISDPDDPALLQLGDHPARLVRTALALAGRPEFAELHLARWAHAFGYGGHWLSKSRGYSTTFTTLRAARTAHARRRSGGLPLDAWGRPEHEGAVEVVTSWRFIGCGYATAGDRWLALQAADAARSRRELLRQIRADHCRTAA